jgi:hypothetical protein
MGNKNEQPQPDQDHTQKYCAINQLLCNQNENTKMVCGFIVVLHMAASAAAAYWYVGIQRWKC